jgi:sugar/nucleoside kinase (ribokinase family)
VSRYLVCGNLTVDDTVFPDGSTAMGSIGGNVLYAAVGVRVWTDDVAMLSRLGRGYPEESLRHMRQSGLRTEGLTPSPHHCIRQWQLYDVEGGRTYVRLASAGTYEDLAPRPDEASDAVTSGAEACHIAPMRVDLQGTWVEWARGRGYLVSVDPHFDWIEGRVDAWRALLPEVDVFLPSREEAELFLGAWPGAEAAARALAEWGAGVTCIKLGSDGAVMCRAGRGDVLRIPSVSQAVVDSTGCGDAFCGGFLVGWNEREDLLEAGLCGAVSASFVACGFGAQHAMHPDRAVAAQRLREVTGAVAHVAP